MKNKKTLYFLLPAAAILWGYIIYMVVSGMGANNDHIPSLAKPIVLTDSLIMKEDSFSLSLAYNDPFLKKVKVSHSADKANTKPATSPKPKALPKNDKPPVNWPTISYGGSIAGGDTKKEVIILVIANQEEIGKEGDVLKGGVKIVHIAPNVIGLEYKGDSKIISR